MSATSLGQPRDMLDPIPILLEAQIDACLFDTCLHHQTVCVVITDNHSGKATRRQHVCELDLHPVKYWAHSLDDI